MTTFAELTALTTQITRRPELGPLTATAVRAAVQRAHSSGFFFRDSASQILTNTLTSNPWVDAGAPWDLIPRLRVVEQVQMLDLTTLTPVEQLRFEERTNILTPERTLKSGVYTLEGSMLRLYPAVLTERCNVQFYSWPVMTDLGFNSWIANEYPEEIAFWAASVVFARSGAMEQAQMLLRSHVTPFKELLMESYTVATVY